MGEVDVHRDDHVVALVEGDGEAVAVGAAEALLAGAAQQLDLAELRRRLLDDRSPCRPGCCRRRPARRRRAASARTAASSAATFSRSLYVGRTTTVRGTGAGYRSASGAPWLICTARRNTRSTPSADWSHVSVRARASAAVARRSRRAGSRDRARRCAGPSASGGTSTPGAPVDDGAAVAADVGRHGGRGARRRLGQRQSPTLGQRGAADEPRLAVLVTERLARQVTEQVDPARCVVLGDPPLQVGAHADPRRRCAAAGRARRGGRRATASTRSRNRFTGARRATATTVGCGPAIAAGREERVDAVVDGRDAVGPEAELDAAPRGSPPTA